MTQRIIVTGGSGKLGRHVIQELKAHGYRVLNVDRLPPHERLCGNRSADLTDLGQFVDALDAADGLIHLAGIPSPHQAPETATFTTNVVSTFNAFQAARIRGLRRVVWASSEMTAGTPFHDRPPRYLPLDEAQPARPRYGYSLSKKLGEHIGEYFHDIHGIASAALRFSSILPPEVMARLSEQGGSEPDRGYHNFWGYVDPRDAAAACRCALEAPLDSAEAFFITADDTTCPEPSAELAQRYYPKVELRPLADPYATLISNEKARRMLGFVPQHSWRTEGSSDSTDAELRRGNPRPAIT